MLRGFVETQQKLVTKLGNNTKDEAAATAKRLEKLLEEVLVSFEEAAEAFFHSELYDKCYLCVQTIRILDAQRRELVLQSHFPSLSNGGVVLASKGGFLFGRDASIAAAASSSGLFNSIANVALTGIPDEISLQLQAQQQQLQEQTPPHRPSSLRDRDPAASSVATATPDFENTATKKTTNTNTNKNTNTKKNNHSSQNSNNINNNNNNINHHTNLADSEMGRRQSAVSISSHVSDPLALLLMGSGCDFNVEDWIRVLHSFVVAQSSGVTHRTLPSVAGFGGGGSSGGSGGSAGAISTSNLALQKCTDIVNFYRDACVTIGAELPSRMRNVLIMSSNSAATTNSSSNTTSLLLLTPGTQKVVWEEMIRILEKN